nr:hypothetical protein [Tanacetum cinerariifolium]
MEVEPLNKTQPEDLGLNTCNHDIPLSFREIPSFDEPEPQLHPFPTFPSLKVDLGEEKDPKPPIRPPSPDSFRIKEVDHLTIHTPPLPQVASFHPNNTYCYYHPCIDDPKKHYGFKPDPHSTPQVLLSFKKNTPSVTYLDEVEETIEIPMEVEPLNKTQPEDLGLNTCNHDIPLSFREIPSFDEPEPQLHPFPTFPSLKVDLGEEKDPKPPIRPPSPDSFRIKEVDHLTIHTPPLPQVASFHPNNTYCYYHPCIDDPKKHYGFKPGTFKNNGDNVQLKCRGK